MADMNKRPVAFRIPRLFGDTISHYCVTTSEDEARAMADTNQVEYEGLYLVGDRHTGDDAQAEQEPAGYQFRQRSGVGKGPQSSAPWCDWCAIDRETYEIYQRVPNRLVQVRPVYAAPVQNCSAGSDLEERVVEAITEWIGETPPEHALAAAREAIAVIRAVPQTSSMRAALEPFATYEMVVVGFEHAAIKDDLKDCTWVAGFVGDQPQFKHFKNARDALALSRPPLLRDGGDQ